MAFQRSHEQPRRFSQLRRAWTWLATSCLSLVLGGTGCVSLDMFVTTPAVRPPDKPCQVIATWDRDVMFVPDPARMGQPAPGIAGRVYLFGPKIDYPMAAEGTLVVDLFDDAGAPPPGVTRAPMEEWKFDRVTLKRLMRKDAIGMGYTVFLPWGTYRPDITHVHMRVRFEPVDGTPLYSEGSPLTLHQPQQAKR